MSFLWPQLLWLLATLPLLLLLYLWQLARRKRLALRYASLSLVRNALGHSATWRRHVPPALLLLALALLLLAGARPMTTLALPTQQQTIILAIDVSGSMRATDVEPNRLAAAQNAAKTFLAELPRQVKVGVVAFAGNAQLVQQPTLNRGDLVTAIDRFQLQRATATGNAIVISLAALFPQEGITLDWVEAPVRRAGRAVDATDHAQPPNFQPVAPGSYNAGAIIMLTDGQRTTGVEPLDAARLAAEHGVRVYTVGIGTVEGETIGFEGWSMRVQLDEQTLKAIARQTQADYFYAGSAADLKKVYSKLSSQLTVEKTETEVTALFALAAALLTLLAGSLSLWWFNRVL